MPSVSELARLIHTHRNEDHDHIRSVLGDMRAPDIAEILNAVPSLGEAADVLEILPIEKAIDVCDEPTLGRRPQLLEQLPADLAARLLEGIASDERTAIVRRMSAHGRRLLFPLLSTESRREVERLLQYEEGTAGDLMTTEFVRLSPTISVGEALGHIRTVARDRELIYACYVVEPGSDHLLGAVSLRDLVMAESSQRVGDVMRPHPVAVQVGEP